MRIFLLTVGTQGDVQPFVALGEGLQKAGHRVTLATGRGFDQLIAPRGLNYTLLDADYLQLMQTPEGKAALAGKNPLGAMKRVMPLLREVLDEAWQAAKGAELIVYHPKALAGYHIAEKLGIPGVLSLPVPLFSPTRAFPSPILPPGLDLGGPLNKLSHRLVVALTTAPYRKLVTTWRRETLLMPPADDERLLGGKPVLRIYPYSPHVLPVPPDWDDSTAVTGYWFLKPDPTWQPPADLVAFLENGAAPVYIGFGSMAAPDAARTTAIVLEAVQKAGVRAVLASGWGGLVGSALHANVFALESAPHEWLFPRMAAVVHHGGAGTVAAGLRAGKPTVVCPLFGDQPFWGHRIHTLGVGPKPVPLKRLTVDGLAQAIHLAVTDEGMCRRAETLGGNIRAENGVVKAVDLITLCC